MSNDTNQIERLFRLQAKINMMVADGKRDAGAVSDALQVILEKTPNERARYCHLHSTTLGPTKGSTTIIKARDVINYDDTSFKGRRTDVEGKDTGEVMVDVYGTIRARRFKTVFDSLGDPRSLVLSQGQIVEFCRTHLNLLSQDYPGTFFLFEVMHVLFITHVYVHDGKLYAGIMPFASYIRHGTACRHRLVVRHQAV